VASRITSKSAKLLKTAKFERILQKYQFSFTLCHDKSILANNSKIVKVAVGSRITSKWAKLLKTAKFERIFQNISFPLHRGFNRYTKIPRQIVSCTQLKNCFSCCWKSNYFKMGKTPENGQA
jgi:hypothetical protein